MQKHSLQDIRGSKSNYTVALTKNYITDDNNGSCKLNQIKMNVKTTCHSTLKIRRKHLSFCHRFMSRLSRAWDKWVANEVVRCFLASHIQPYVVHYWLPAWLTAAANDDTRPASSSSREKCNSDKLSGARGPSSITWLGGWRHSVDRAI